MNLLFVPLQSFTSRKSNVNQFFVSFPCCVGYSNFYHLFPACFCLFISIFHFSLHLSFNSSFFLNFFCIHFFPCNPNPDINIFPMSCISFCLHVYPFFAGISSFLPFFLYPIKTSKICHLILVSFTTIFFIYIYIFYSLFSFSLFTIYIPSHNYHVCILFIICQ